MTVRMSCVDAVRDRWDVFDGAKRIGRSLSLDAADRLAAQRAYPVEPATDRQTEEATA